MMKRWCLCIAVLCTSLAVCFLMAAVKESVPYVQAQAGYSRIREKYTIAEEAEDYEEVQRTIDFDGLQEINGDIAAWICVPGTQIDYPVCLAAKDRPDYYLNHNIYRQENMLGTLFIGAGQCGAFTDRHTVLYGHNMESGQMFGELSNYAEQDFQEKYPYVYLYTPEEELVFQVCRAFRCESGAEVYRTAFDSDKEYVQWLRRITEDLVWSDQLLTLSTCTEENGDERFVVQCKRVRTEEGGMQNL